jgi:flagellar biosynthesis/type III secretory pathway ATPase
MIALMFRSRGYVVALRAASLTAKATAATLTASAARGGEPLALSRASLSVLHILIQLSRRSGR